MGGRTNTLEFLANKVPLRKTASHLLSGPAKNVIQSERKTGEALLIAGPVKLMPSLHHVQP